MTWIAIAVGGALGSVARHAVNHLAHSHWLTARVGIGTITVNLVGCFLIGMLAALLATERIALPFQWREFVFVGLLGGFTTFSAFGLDTYLLVRTHSISTALWYVALQVLGGLAAVAVGYAVGIARV